MIHLFIHLLKAFYAVSCSEFDFFLVSEKSEDLFGWILFIFPSQCFQIEQTPQKESIFSLLAASTQKSAPAFSPGSSHILAKYRQRRTTVDQDYGTQKAMLKSIMVKNFGKVLIFENFIL